MTTKTKQALAWIALGKPYKEMAKDLGLTQSQCSQLIDNLRVHGYIETVPATYQLTDKGRARHEHVPKTDPKILERQRRNYHKRLARQEVSPEKIVAFAKRSQPNSVFNLAGGMQ
jgi:DNA-binding MarR family transcriptional regulator